MELRKIRICDLRNFADSEWFVRLPVCPISSLRVESYLANPHAQPDDPVLYFFQHEEQIVAFRTVFPAMFNNEEKRFVWLSGVWTKPEVRRQGLARRLLDEVYSDWEGRVMAVNLAPTAERLLGQSGLHKSARTNPGRRFYLFLKSRDLLQPRLGNLFFIWPVIDFIFRVAATVKIRRNNTDKNDEYRWETLLFPDPDCFDLANKQSDLFVFRRAEAELKWIFAYPWISTDDKRFLYRYPFSSFAGRIEKSVVKFYRENEFLGFLIYSIRDGHFKLVHQNFEHECTDIVAQFIMEESIHQKIAMLTVLDSVLANRIRQMSNPFVFSKIFAHQFYAGECELPQNSKLQPAEGDFIFT